MRQPVPFGKYLLLDRISVGGMAEVFKAKSYGVEGFEKVIAIKRILPSMGEDADFIKMFIDEAKIAGQLSHANICQIFELGKIDGSHFIAMEYIWGKDLLQIQNRVKRRKTTVPVLMACYVIAKACEGLHYSHKRRDPMGSPLEIVHRDASPQNLLVSYEGEVKVIDFGIARAASRSSRTQAGVLKGKFGYMSPEQVRGLPLDRRSDIFSLGTVLYETLTGERLFVGESDFSTLERVRNADITPPSELNNQIPPEVERIVLRALCRDRDKRYQWCSEMQADLQAYLTAQDEVVSNKGLGEAVRALFADELDREKQQMERYKRVGRDGLISGVPQARADLDVNDELGEAGPLDGDPTILGGPDFEDIFPESVDGAPGIKRPIAAGKSDAIEVDRSAYSSNFDDEASTSIFDEGDHRIAPQGPGPGRLADRLAAQGAPVAGRASTAQGAGPAMAATALAPRGFGPPHPPPGAGRPTQMGQGMPLGTPHDRDPSGGYNRQPTAHMHGPGAPHQSAFSQSGNGHGRMQPVPMHGPPISYPMQTQGYNQGYGPYGHAAQLVAMPTSRKRGGRAVRDIAIGVGIAAIVLTLFAVGRYLLSSSGESSADRRGQIEVSLSGAKVASVLIDGDAAGTVESSKPLLLPATVGSREVVVQVEGEAPCTQTVAVSDSETARVECSVAGETLDGIEGGDPQEGEPNNPSSAVDGGVATAIDAAASPRVEGPEDGGPVAARVDPRKLEEQKEARAARDRAAKEKLAKEKLAKDKAREARDKAAEESAEPVGYLVANSAPYARVIVDGKNSGKMTPMTTGEKISLKPGKHSVTFVVGKKKHRYSVTIESGKIKRFYRVLPKDDQDEEDD